MTETTLNAELYAAAKKAGMENALYRAQVEVYRCSAGFRIMWEQELVADCECEHGCKCVDYTAIKRAETWLAKRTAR